MAIPGNVLGLRPGYALYAVKRHSKSSVVACYLKNMAKMTTVQTSDMRAFLPDLSELDGGSDLLEQVCTASESDGNDTDGHDFSELLKQTCSSENLLRAQLVPLPRLPAPPLSSGRGSAGHSVHTNQ